MQLKSINVSDFLGITNASIEFGPVTSIAGRNWSGKTSLRQAIRLIVSGRSERGINLATKQNANRWMLVREGADKADIKCATDIGLFQGTISGSKNYETQRRETALPVCQDDLLPHVLNPTGYSTADDETRRKILFWLAAKSYDPDEIKTRLIDMKFDEEKVERLMPNLISGKFDGAVNQCEINIKKCRSDWGQITGETYGDKKYKTWAAPEFKVNEKDLKDIEKKVKATVEDIERNSKKLSLSPFKCDKCGKMVAEVPDNLIELQEIVSVLNATLSDHQALTVQISTQLEHNKRAEEKTAAALKKGDDLNEWKAIKEALGPDGIQGEVLGEIIKEYNENLSDATVFEKKIVIDNETCEPTVNGRPYTLASEAEQFICDAYLQMAMAIMSGANLVLIDRFDVLHPTLRQAFLNELLGRSIMNGLQSVVFATLKAPINYNGVKSYWMENGQSKSSDQAPG